VLLSSDGAEVDQAYLQMFKPETLILIVAPEDLPVPYSPHIGDSVPVKKMPARAEEQ
jgi:hypothetical protein